MVQKSLKLAGLLRFAFFELLAASHLLAAGTRELIKSRPRS